MSTRVQKAICPNPRHARSRVAAWGTTKRSTGTFQSYRCQPLTGKTHRFSLPIEATSRRRRSAGGGPACPHHPGSPTIRYGAYRKPPLPPRQLYECRHPGKCSETCQKVCDGRGHEGPCRFICLKECAGDHDGPCFRPCRTKRETCEAEHDGTCIRLCPARCDGSHDGDCVRACRKACDGTHTFTPPLPRFHVKSGDECADCLELRGYHRGEMAVARGHRPTARNIAQALNDESLGESYAKVGRAVLLRAGVKFEGTPRRRPSETTQAPTDEEPPDGPVPDEPPDLALLPPPDAPDEDAPDRPVAREPEVIADALADPPSDADAPPLERRRSRRRSASSAQGARFWHVGADIAEAFAPVLWEKTERDLRERDALNATLGPVVWLMDEIPVYALDRTGRRRKTDGYSIFCVAGLDWSDKESPGRARLRLVRALPKNTSIAWRLVFEELADPTPRVIVSDAATSIMLAVPQHFGTGPDAPLLVPSIWHLKRALETNALADALKGESVGSRSLAAHLGSLGRASEALRSVEGWHDWWARLDRLADATGRVKPRSLAAAHDNYEDRMAAALPLLLAEPRISQSTGGMEAMLRNQVAHMLPNRKQQFANIERTNNLLDLVVVRANDGFLDLNAVARLIEADELPHGGRTVPMRAIADPCPRDGTRYRSLRDEYQMNAVAAARGLL